MSESTSKKPMKPPFPLETVPIEKLDLDLRNSRFPRDAQSQDDALELMLTTAGQDCLQLLRDITRSGEMNSSDVPIVIRKGTRFVVMEGNRRLTCLRIWDDVTVLAEINEVADDYRSKAQRLISDSDYAAPAELRVAIAPSEEAADHWIERKHSGGAGGTGTVEWGAAMKDRRKARNNPAAASRAMAFIELVSAEFDEDHELLTDLETVRTKRYTMIQRFVDRGVVRERLGLEFDAGRMSFAYGSEVTQAIVRTVLHDFAQPKATSGKTWARELDTVADFAEYLNGYAHLIPHPEASTAGASGDSTHPNTSGGAGAGDASAAPRGGDAMEPHGKETNHGAPDDPRPPRPTPPVSHIFRGMVLDQFTNRIQEIVRQTSHLNVQRQTEIASVLLRVILELATYQFLTSHNREPENALDKRLKSAIKQIEPQASNALGQAESTSALCKAFHETTADSIRLVQYAVHDVRGGRTAGEVLTLAERYTPVLVAMNANMGNNPVT